MNANHKTEDNVYPKCLICNQVPEGGLHDGFFLLGKFICSTCEEKMLTVCSDDPAYDQLLQIINDAFYGSIAKQHM